MRAVVPSSPVFVAMLMSFDPLNEKGRLVAAPIVSPLLLQSELAERRFGFGANLEITTKMIADVDDLNVPVDREARPGRDEMTHDNVLLEAAQMIDSAQRCGFRKDARRVLERSSGDERV